MRHQIKNNSLLVTYLLNKIAMKISKSLTGKLSCQLWFSPSTKPPASKRSEYEAKSKVRIVQVRNHKLNLRTWNEGSHNKPIMLLHGWGGSWDQFTHLIEALVAMGFEVSAIDMPAHGESAGYSTDLLEWFDVIEACDKVLKKDNMTYICHSFGFMAVSEPVFKDKIKAQRIIAINSPTRFQFLVDQFMEKVGLKEKFLKPLLTNIHKRVGDKVDERVNVEIRKLVQKTEVIFIADEDDKEVPFSEHTELQAVLKNRFFATKGLGHNKILRSSELLEILQEVLKVRNKAV